ncbi:MAG: DNA repair protein RadA [Planctomycetes bacterium]|nr:DNA repair protein RadA [Planctomycetota bacterium]
MATRRPVFLCTSCGDTTPKWQGRCPSCGEWNSLVEHTVRQGKGSRSRHTTASSAPRRASEIPSSTVNLTPSGIAEFDRVLGGGIPPAASILVAGEPGVGKSTLMLQVAASPHLQPALYVTSEESAAAVAERSRRIAPDSDPLILAENDLDTVLDACEKSRPRTVVVDSLQMFASTGSSLSGTPSAVRETAAALGRYAHRENGAAVFMVGHITKAGAIAGPKLVEHMVDAVLYFEAEGNLALRLLRARKNRFASTDSVGVFSMKETGLAGISDPSGFFMDKSHSHLSGTAPTAALIGDRVLFLDVQALVSGSDAERPGARRVSGLDPNRTSMILAVLERRVGLKLQGKDVFLNVAGGVAIREPASDLAVAASILSNMADIPFSGNSVFVGEVGLGGEVRRVSHVSLRVREAARMGFKQIILPKSNSAEAADARDISVVFVDNVSQIRKML